jgi:transposase
VYCLVFLGSNRYDADYVVAEVVKTKGQVVIPSKSNGKKPRDFDKHLYKERNLIEGMFNKIKHFRPVATRYDKTKAAYLAFVLIAGICLWLK